MTTGAEHYRNAMELITLSVDQECDTPEERSLYAAAQITATLALAAAVALLTTSEMVGDSDEITDWARLVQPKGLAGGRMKWVSTGDRAEAAEDSEGVEPRRGDIWADRDGNCWLAQIGVVNMGPLESRDAKEYKVYLARLDGLMKDDFFSVISEEHGPMRLVNRPWLAEDNECLF